MYVLWNREDKKFYIGFTRNIKRRLTEHRSGKVRSTNERKHMKLIYYEAHLSELDARRRERYFKTTKGRKTLRLMLKDTLSYSGIV